MMIKGNKGEWSEMYVFLRVLSDGRIYGADGNLNKKIDVYYDVNRIVRNEKEGLLDYIISTDGKNVDVMLGDKLIAKIKRDKVSEETDILLKKIIASNETTFSVEETELLMEEMHCSKLKAPSSDKSDITIEVHDYRTGMNPILGFSIKSSLGHPSTLVNAGKTTNFVFRLSKTPNTEQIITVNGDEMIDGKTTKQPSLSVRYKSLISSGINLIFDKTECETLQDNLETIADSLPQIVAEMIKLHFIDGISSVKEQIKMLNERNPLKYKNLDTHPKYELKIRNLLEAYALGMLSATPWKGNEDANGGYIIVKKDGDIVCYHIYNRNDFKDYLVNHTRLETASTSRHGFSKIYEENGEYYLKLNLQIRFI